VLVEVFVGNDAGLHALADFDENIAILDESVELCTAT
jgi:hypothetical protein